MNLSFTELDRIRPHEMDDSAGRAAILSRHRALHRTARLLRSCIPSMSDESDTRKAASARAIVCTYAKRRSRVLALQEHPFHVSFHLFHRGLQESFAGVENNRPPITKLPQMQPDGFAHSPLEAVSDHRFAKSSGDGKPNLRPVREVWIRKAECCEVCARETRAL